MNWTTHNLPELLDQLQQALHAAPAHPGDPLRTAMLATAAEPGPTARTVILRNAHSAARHLVFHTDARSAKLREISSNPAVAWLFHHPGEQLQIRAAGTAAVLHITDLVREAWTATPTLSRVNYCTLLPPGTPLAAPDAGLPAAWRHREPTREETEIGWANFTVVTTTITRFDWLLLRPCGARRARFDWDGSAWAAEWLVP